MTLPTPTRYPDSIDGDDNLFLVHDGLRLSLVEDYTPGDTSIQVDGDLILLNRFPPSGAITLTEQCSDIDRRAISLHYSAVDPETGIFSGLELMDGFTDVVKPKRITNVTQNVMAWHHNHVKDALVAIQTFAGVKGTIDTEPFGPTLEGRINFLRKLVLVPKAWFTVNKRQGIIPLEVEFTERAFRLGTDGTAGPVVITWDFGDQTSSTISYSPVSYSPICVTSVVPDDAVDVIVRDMDGGKIKKTYHRPGIYTVKLTVQNDFGSDDLILDDLIRARVKAPDPASIRYIHNTGTQLVTHGTPTEGPYTTPPKIRSPINALIRIEVPTGVNPSNDQYSYAGELLNENQQAIDPIDHWTWSVGDDMDHEDSRSTTCLFSVGGIYDLKLRVDTEFGAYRITTYEDAIDIVENTNLWLWTYTGIGAVRSYEYGLLSETFKTTPVSTLAVTRNENFLNSAANGTGQRREFRRNVAMQPRSTAYSGAGGACLLYWASGRNAADARGTEKIMVQEYTGFSNTYVTRTPIGRPWNWFRLGLGYNSYFFGGSTLDEPLPDVSPVNTNLTQHNLATLSFSTSAFSSQNYLNGAQELETNPALWENSEPVYGHFSVYRSTTIDNTGYFARNDAVGPFFRIKSFYRTIGTITNPFQSIEKLTDIYGTKVEGGLASLTSGVFFFNNSGTISAYQPSASTWRAIGSGTSAGFRQLQDTSVEGFDDQANTLMLTSDKASRAYISFDYSTSAFIKFNELSTTFSTLGVRPQGEQWMLGTY